VLIAGSAIAIASGENDHTVVATASGKGVFREKTRTVLAFSDGLDGLLLVDLDHSRAVRHPLGGGSPSESGLIRLGDSFVVRDDNGDALAMPIDGGAPMRLGPATIAFEASGLDAAWLVEWPGGRIGAGTPTFRLVDIEGAVQASPVADDPLLEPTNAVPVAALGNVILFEASDGVLAWDTTTNGVSNIGTGASFIGDVHQQGLVSWCPDACTELHLADVLHDTDRVVARTERGFDARQSRFSPDGRYVAVTEDPDVILIDVKRGIERTAARNIARFAYLGWSSDGRDLYFSEYSWMKSSTAIGRFDLDARHLDRTTLPIGSALAFVTLSRGDARDLLDAPDGPKRECTAPSVYPSGRTDACGFRF
jgi:hypothetical protein